MSDTVIRVENLGKKYLIRHEQHERYVALRDVIANKVKSFSKILFTFKPRASNLQPSKEEFWALRDINFEVHQGDRIGIIGRNGAGKTTLLKLLSRITEPTTGRIAIKGRVASLLEVGTGFHPELTGRENIFLNGAILGMGKAEIKKKFDEIVDFAETEKFLDTPVKRYSSGMYVRLAFAVAAHLEPDILLVDEVLAVGDAAFQKKCLGKMGEVASEGRTVLFVSHNIAAVQTLCTRAILLEDGRINVDDIPHITITRYLDDGCSYERPPLSERRRRWSSDLARLSWASLIDCDGNPRQSFEFGDSLRLRLGFDTSIPMRVALEVYLRTGFSETVACFASSHFQGLLFESKGEGNVAELVIHGLPLAQGRYYFDVGISVPNLEWLDFVENACTFEIQLSDPGRTGFSFEQGKGHGLVYLDHEWIINPRA